MNLLGLFKSSPAPQAPTTPPTSINPRNHYEGAQQSVERSTLSTTWQDADKDISKARRVKIAEKSRYLLRNSGLLAGIHKRFVTYVVGTGVTFGAASSDEKFNELADAAWQAHKDKLDIETDACWQEICEIVFGTTVGDGSLYSQKTWDPAEVSPVNPAALSPKIQLWEVHRLGSNAAKEGITFDEYSRPKAYHFKDAPEPIPASDIVPHYFPTRARQHYGMSIYAPIINTAHDIEDILNFERAAVKDACSKTDVIETATAEAPTSNLAKSNWGSQTRTETADNSTTNQSFYQKIFGASARYIRKGDKHTQYTPQRPSPTFQGLMDFLSHTVCLPLGMPPSTLLQIKVGGADTRRDLAAAGRVIECYQVKLAKQLHQIWVHVVDSVTPEEGRPDDWQSAECEYPAVITADAGRERQHDREDLGMGTLSLRVFCGANGFGSVRGYFRQRARDITARDLAARAENVFRESLALPPLKPEQIFNFDYKSQPSAPPTPAPADPNAEPAATPAPTPEAVTA